MDPLWISVGVTAFLAVITSYYAIETRKIRKTALCPRFSLQAGLYTMRGMFHVLYLRNTGPVARDVNITIRGNRMTVRKEEPEDIYIPSLNTGEAISIMADPYLQQIIEQKGVVAVSINCKDASNEKHVETLPSIDFAELAKSKRKFARITIPTETSYLV